jgi:predicted nucleic acid-binding protein
MKTPRALVGATGVVLDTNVFIYCFEDNPEYGAVAEHVIAEAARGRFRGAITPVTIAEMLVKPLRAKRGDLAARYRSVLMHLPNIEPVALDSETGSMAGALRAKYGLPLPDMLQVAAAMRAARPTIVTNDEAIRRVTEVTMVSLGDLA